MSASHEIRTVEEFEAVKRLPVGVVVITDTATGTKAHRPSTCPYVTVGYFTTKVIDGGGKNGRYYAYLRFEDAARETDAEWCSVCH